MYGIGGNAHISLDDGIYGGLVVSKGAGALEVLVKAGLAIVGGEAYSREVAEEATVVASAPAAAGTYFVYLNRSDAKDSAGAVIGRFSVNKPEADQAITAINGSVAEREGRSLVLAKVTVAGGAITAVDNAAKLKNFASRRTRRVGE